MVSVPEKKLATAKFPKLALFDVIFPVIVALPNTKSCVPSTIKGLIFSNAILIFS